MGTFYGQDEKPSFSQQIASSLGIPDLTKKPPGEQPTFAPTNLLPGLTGLAGTNQNATQAKPPAANQQVNLQSVRQPCLVQCGKDKQKCLQGGRGDEATRIECQREYDFCRYDCVGDGPCKTQCSTAFQTCMASSDTSNCFANLISCVQACERGGPNDCDKNCYNGCDSKYPNSVLDCNNCCNSCYSSDPMCTGAVAFQAGCLNACKNNCPEGQEYDETLKKCRDKGIGYQMVRVCTKSLLLPTQYCPQTALKEFQVTPIDKRPKTNCTTHIACVGGAVWDPVKKKCICPEGTVWDNTTQKCSAQPGVCPPGITPGEQWNGCPCGKKYMLPAGQTACTTGYVPAGRGDVPGVQCECSKWCVAIGYGEDCKTRQTCEECKAKCEPLTGSEKSNCLIKCGEGPCKAEELGEYQWPPELRELYNMLMGRAKEYMERRPGFSDSAMELMFGKGTDEMREGGLAQQIALQNQLNAAGLTGTGAGQAMLGEKALSTQKGIGELIRDMAILNQTETKKDREAYTNIANELFGTGTGYNSLLEQINASRRGEGRQLLELLIAYLQALMGGWAQ